MPSLTEQQPRAPARLPVTGAKPEPREQAVWSLNDERFSCFEITDETEGERLDRAAVIAGETRIAANFS